MRLRWAVCTAVFWAREFDKDYLGYMHRVHIMTTSRKWSAL